jgi:hypothetical protein
VPDNTIHFRVVERIGCKIAPLNAFRVRNLVKYWLRR